MKRIVLTLFVTTLVAAGLLAATQAGKAPGDQKEAKVGQHHKNAAAAGRMILTSVERLEVSLQKARAAAESGDAKSALAELTKAQDSLTAVRKHLQACPMVAAAKKPANSVCPIMGGKIDADKVSPELTRTFEGKTVAFCCGGCPAKWDQLSDEQKRAKLAPHVDGQGKTQPHRTHHMKH
jgi:hypothetical protein